MTAVRSALDKTGFAIISAAMKDCLAEPHTGIGEDKTTPEQLERLFLMLA